MPDSFFLQSSLASTSWVKHTHLLTSNSSWVLNPFADYSKASIGVSSSLTLSLHVFSSCRISLVPINVDVKYRETYASRWCSGILASTPLMSPLPNPVNVRLCFGRENSGPTGPWSSEIGALVDGLRSLDVVLVVDIVIAPRILRWRRGELTAYRCGCEIQQFGKLWFKLFCIRTWTAF